MHVTVVSPERAVFDGAADAVVAPAYDGQGGVLPGHAPFLALLGTGVLAGRQGGAARRLGPLPRGGGIGGGPRGGGPAGRGGGGRGAGPGPARPPPGRGPGAGGGGGGGAGPRPRGGGPPPGGGGGGGGGDAVRIV